MFVRRQYDNLLATCFRSICGLLVPSHPAPEYLVILIVPGFHVSRVSQLTLRVKALGHVVS